MSAARGHRSAARSSVIQRGGAENSMPIQGARELGKELADIKKGEGKSVYVVHGNEPFLVRNAADSLARALAERGGAEIVRVDAAGLDPDRALEAVVSPGLFAAARVAIVRNFASLLGGEAADRLLANLDAGLSGGSAVIFAAAGGDQPGDRIDKRLRGFKGLAARGVVLALDRQKPEDLLQWLADTAAKEGKKLDRDAAQHLLSRSGPDMEALRAELNKALLYCLDRDRIRAKGLVKLVGKTREDQVWDVTEAVTQGEAARAREMVRDLEVAGTHPLVVLTLLVRQARHLLQARLLWEHAGRPAFRDYRSFQSRVVPLLPPGMFGKGSDDVTTMHPFAAFKRFEAARSREESTLRDAFARLRAGESDIKTGNAEGASKVVEELVLELAIRFRSAA